MQLRNRVLTVFLTVAVSVSLAGNGPGAGNGEGLGQGEGQTQGQQKRGRTGEAQLNMDGRTTIEGTVVSVNNGGLLQFPSITVGTGTAQVEIKVGPVWYFEELDAEIEVGDIVIVDAVPSVDDLYYYAISIRNEPESYKLQFRDSETGQALWARRNGAGGQGNGAGIGLSGDQSQIREHREILGGCTLQDVVTVAGTVESVSVGAGLSQPRIVLATASELLTIRLGPARTLLAAGFEILEGAAFTVRYGVSPCSGELIAVELINENGTSFRIRNDDGTPLF